MRCSHHAEGKGGCHTPHCMLYSVVMGGGETHQIKGLRSSVLEVGTQAGLQVLGRHVPLGLHRLLCTASQLAQVQCGPISHLNTTCRFWHKDVVIPARRWQGF